MATDSSTAKRSTGPFALSIPGADGYNRDRAPAQEETMIATRNADPDPRHADLGTLLGDLSAGLEHNQLDLVLGCFHPNAVLHAPDEPVPLEGLGSLRSYFRRRIRAQRFVAVPRILGIDFGGSDRAILRARCDAPGGDQLVFALSRTGGRWLITHGHWTRDPGPETPTT